MDETFEEGPLCIMDCRDQVLRRKTVRLVASPWIGGVNVGARGHDVGHLCLLV